MSVFSALWSGESRARGVARVAPAHPTAGWQHALGRWAPEPHHPALLGLPNQRATQAGAETATSIFSTSGTRKSKTQVWTGLALCEAFLVSWQVVAVQGRARCGCLGPLLQGRRSYWARPPPWSHFTSITSPKPSSPKTIAWWCTAGEDFEVCITPPASRLGDSGSPPCL